MWPQLSYNGFEISDPNDQAKGAQNSSISKSPLPSLSNFLKSFGMSSGPTGRRVVRKKKNRRGPKENKTTCCSWFRGLWRYLSWAVKFEKNLRWVLFVGSKVEDFFC